MTQLSDFRSRVLYAMGLTSSTERGFDNNSIDQHVLRAAEEFSLFLPVQAVATPTVSAGARSFALAGLTRPIRVRAVEYPTGQWPRALLDFDVWGDTVTLDYPPQATSYAPAVYFDQQHLIDAVSSTIAPEHEGVIVEGAACLALLARAAGSANVFDSATVQPTTYQFLRIAQERCNRWRRSLRLLAAQRRTRRLYTPAQHPLGRDIVTPYTVSP